ncbi:MAG: iron chaperone [Micrococcaceae bacterium]
MTSVADHDAYIDAASETFRPVLARLRHLLSDALPEAEEITAYNMPGFTINGTVVASYAAFSKQVGLYVLAPAIAENAEAIAEAGLKASKTGITFTPRKLIPDDLVTRLAQASRTHASSAG